MILVPCIASILNFFVLTIKKKEFPSQTHPDRQTEVMNGPQRTACRAKGTPITTNSQWTNFTGSVFGHFEPSSDKTLTTAVRIH